MIVAGVNAPIKRIRLSSPFAPVWARLNGSRHRTVGVSAVSIAAALIACGNDERGAEPHVPDFTAEALVSWWNESRNVGDVTGAFALLDDGGVVFGYALDDPDDRSALLELLAAQSEADWRVIDAPCTTAGETVTCDYVMFDEILRRWGLSFTGTHTYVVRDGRIVRAERSHDPSSSRRIDRALAEFRDWVSEHHPDLVDVIWSTPGAAAYTSVDGARAMVTLLDEYDVSPSAGV